MCSFFKSSFTVTGNNNTINSNNRIGSRNFYSKLSIIVFQIYLIRLIESEESRETSIVYRRKDLLGQFCVVLYICSELATPFTK